MADMTIKYTLEPHDMLVFQKFMRKHLPAMKRIRYLNMAFVALVSIFIISTGTLSKVSIPIRILMFFVIYLLVWTFCWSLDFIFKKIAFWRSYTSDKHRSILCQHTITLANDALIEATAYNESRHRWSGIYRVADAEEYIYVFISQNQAYIIPKRAFDDAESASRFFEHAERLQREATMNSLSN